MTGDQDAERLSHPWWNVLMLLGFAGVGLGTLAARGVGVSPVVSGATLGALALFCVAGVMSVRTAGGHYA